MRSDKIRYCSLANIPPLAANGYIRIFMHVGGRRLGSKSPGPKLRNAGLEASNGAEAIESERDFGITGAGRLGFTQKASASERAQRLFAEKLR